MRPRRAYCNCYLLVPEEVDEPEVSLPLALPVVPELMLPLEPLLSEDELDDGVDVPPDALEPYCFTQSSRSVPVMPAHWLGSDSLEPPVVLAGVELSLLELAGALGVVAVSEELLPVDCAQAALASSAAATAAARDFSVMKLSFASEGNCARPVARAMPPFLRSTYGKLAVGQSAGRARA